MVRAVLALFLTLATLSTPAAAMDRHTLGWGRLFSNDFLGEARDRWRTGSYMVSFVKGPAWSGALPDNPAAILEFRFRGETITPANLVNPAPGDRPYVGALSFGVHTHFQWNGIEVSSGADLVLTGEMTGVGQFQKAMHELLGAPVPTILDDQIPNHVYPTALVEFGYPIVMASNLQLRPFVELQGGVETLARVGADLHFGVAGSVDLFVRDVTTGHRVPVTQTGAPGLSILLGADAAYVENSAYLPNYGGYDISDPRIRVRAGLLWHGPGAQVFYGLTWLGEEFAAQPEGQLVGSLVAKVEF